MTRVTKFRVEGARELEQFMLRELPAKLARKATLQGMRRAAKPMVGIVRAKAPYKSGALKQAIGLKTVPMRGGSTDSQLSGITGGADSTFAALEIGALSGSSGAALHAWARYKAFYGPNFGVLKRGKISPSQIGRIRHAHLMEFGFNHHSGKRVPAQPFLEPGFNSGFLTYKNMLVREVRKQVEAAIRKHNSKSSGPKR